MSLLCHHENCSEKYCILKHLKYQPLVIRMICQENQNIQKNAYKKLQSMIKARMISCENVYNSIISNGGYYGKSQTTNNVKVYFSLKKEYFLIITLDALNRGHVYYTHERPKGKKGLIIFVKDVYELIREEKIYKWKPIGDIGIFEPNVRVFI